MNSRLKDYMYENSVIAMEVSLEQKVYLDESCLEKITSKQYKSSAICQESRIRTRNEMKKSLVKRIRK